MKRIAPNVFIKDPDDLLDYVLDLSSWLDADTLASHSVIVAMGDVVVDRSSINAVPFDVPESYGTRTIGANKAVIVWLRDGTLYSRAEVTVRVETDAGRRMDRSFIVRLCSG